MSDVKWIKITTDIFDDEKILLIESLPDADAIIVIWFKLLCLAGKMNNSGVFMMNNRIAFTDKMLATIFRRKESTVQLALSTFAAYGMIEVIDDVITIPNWGKHQNLDSIESKNEYMREYMKEYRNKQKRLSSGSKTNCKTNCKSNCKSNSKTNCKSNSKTNVSSLEREGELEEDRELESDTEGEKEKNITATCKQVASMYLEICTSYPKITTLSETRKKAIKARLKTYSLDDFKALFEKAETSAFLKGGNDRNWSADFDWLIKDSSMAKVLEGKYDNRSGGRNQAPNKTAQQLDDFYDMAARWAAEGE